MLLTIPIVIGRAKSSFVAVAGFEPTSEAYETSELTVTLNHKFLCQPEQIRTVTK